ncbi:MAG: hypothetical protein R2912_03875 [Eubacteriales bacterium]
MVALALIILLSLFAFVGPLFSPYDYDQFNPGEEDMSPNIIHPFGTDRFGRDLIGGNMYGARISLSIGVVAAFSDIRHRSSADRSAVLSAEERITS